jgi:magnesium-transporting ATPase (P-type)
MRINMEKQEEEEEEESLFNRNSLFETVLILMIIFCVGFFVAVYILGTEIMISKQLADEICTVLASDTATVINIKDRDMFNCKRNSSTVIKDTDYLKLSENITLFY